MFNANVSLKHFILEICGERYQLNVLQNCTDNVAKALFTNYLYILNVVIAATVLPKILKISVD